MGKDKPGKKMVQMRECKLCHKKKPITSFEDRITPGGKSSRRHQCKECRTKHELLLRHKRISKKCPVCLKEKQPNDFVVNNSLDFIWHGKICRECAHKKNIEIKRKNAKIIQPKINIKGELLCCVCEKYKGKTNFYINKLRPTGYDTVCKECRNNTSLKRYRETKEYYVRKLGGVCTICNAVYPWYAYDFHHKENKEVKISKYFRYTIRHLKKKQELEEEIKKCVLVCAICHRKLHLKEENYCGTNKEKG